jgi:hypothetical protein
LVVGQVTKGASTDDAAVANSTIVIVYGSDSASIKRRFLEVGHVSTQLKGCTIRYVYKQLLILRIESGSIHKDVKICERTLVGVRKIENLILAEKCRLI